MSEVNVEPPETIYRILGRNHVYARFDKVQGEENAALHAAPDALIFDMKDYAQQTIDLYKTVAKVDKIKPAQTPFIPDGAWPKEDEDSRGELAPKACSILMKALWLARLSRPDILKPINDLATKVQAWTRVHDNVQYIDTNEQAADIFTKALPPQKWYKALCLLGIRTDIREPQPSSRDRSFSLGSKVETKAAASCAVINACTVNP